jgi:UDP:flavonoid glycosyltransferase YjiC (YdhE family)
LRLTVVTGGSRGDVQPFVALGEGLRVSGHEVTIATYGPFEELVRSRALGFARLSGDPRELIENLLKCGRNPFCLARRFGEALEPLAETNFEECLDACRHADAVVYTGVGYLGYLAAQKLGIPQLGAELQPMFTPTREFPSSLAPARVRPPGPLEGAYNRLTYAVVEQMFWLRFGRVVNDLRRRKLGLPPAPIGGALREIRREGVPVLCGWSPSVLAAPKDWADRTTLVTGYWFLDGPADWRPPEGLESFLDGGPPPVCVGFGSMSDSSAEPMKATPLVAEAMLAR